MSYDVVIIGGGPGGYNCAIRAGQLGLKTAIIESRGKLGGTCLNVGCIPSKALLHASEYFEAATKTFPGMGVKISGLELDLPQMLKQKDDAVDGLTKGIEFLMKKNKVDYIKGFGRIAGKGRVEVTGPDGAKQTLETKNIVVATGSEPTPLPNIDIDEDFVHCHLALPRNSDHATTNVFDELEQSWRGFGLEGFVPTLRRFGSFVEHMERFGQSTHLRTYSGSDVVERFARAGTFSVFHDRHQKSLCLAFSEGRRVFVRESNDVFFEFSVMVEKTEYLVWAGECGLVFGELADGQEFAVLFNLDELVNAAKGGGIEAGDEVVVRLEVLAELGEALRHRRDHQHLRHPAGQRLRRRPPRPGRTM